MKAVGRKQSKGEGLGLDGEYFTAAPRCAIERKTMEEPEEMGDGRKGGVEVNGGKRSGSGSPRIPPWSKARFSVNGDGAGAGATASSRSDLHRLTSPLSSSSLPLRPSLNRNGTTTSSSSSGCNIPSSRVALSDVEKRRVVLQGRVHEARARMPREVVLRVFRDPRECVEVDEVFAREEGQQGEGERKSGEVWKSVRERDRTKEGGNGSS